MSADYKEFDLVDTLRIAAWIEFAGSVVVAILIWSNADERIKPGTLTIKQTDPFDIILGFVVIGIGVFILSVLYALAAILQELRGRKREPRA